MLIQHVFIGNWILTSTKVERDKDIDEFYDTILSIAKNYNIVNEIEYNDKSKSYTLTQEKEIEYMSYIEDYEDEVFWDDLIDKLARRDAIKKIGKEAFENMEQMERATAIWAEEEKYSDEFEKYGINRLKILK